VEKSVLNVDCQNLGFKKMEFNFENFNIQNSRYCNTIVLHGKQYISSKQEEYSPAFTVILPKVMMGLELFT
jgi:hypothetical protein